MEDREFETLLAFSVVMLATSKYAEHEPARICDCFTFPKREWPRVVVREDLDLIEAVRPPPIKFERVTFPVIKSAGVIPRIVGG